MSLITTMIACNRLLIKSFVACLQKFADIHLKSCDSGYIILHTTIIMCIWYLYANIKILFLVNIRTSSRKCGHTSWPWICPTSNTMTLSEYLISSIGIIYAYIYLYISLAELYDECVVTHKRLCISGMLCAFIHVCRLITIGVEFCGEGSSSLQESMRQQSLNYFKNYHRWEMLAYRLLV